MHDRFFIDRIGISKVSLGDVLGILETCTRNRRFGYVCVTNSRTVYLANHDSVYCSIQNNSLLTVPDGIPLVWIAHNLGYQGVEKVSGKTLMDELFRLSETKGYSHYFFGSTTESIEKMQDNIRRTYGELDIKGAVSPPFQPIDAFDVEAIARDINRARPTFFWCGLGAPKQELLMARLQPLLEETFCMGVGLAFEYFAGTVRRAPDWMQRTGLEGVYRILQQPGRVNVQSLKMWLSTLPVLLRTFILKNNAETGKGDI